MARRADDWFYEYVSDDDSRRVASDGIRKLLFIIVISLLLSCLPRDE